MPFLSNDFPDQLSLSLGEKTAGALRYRNDAAQEYLHTVGQSFVVNGDLLPVSVSDEDAPIDFGGSQVNDVRVGAPVLRPHESRAARCVRDLLGYQLRSDNFGAVLYAHRFVDAGPTRMVRGLTATACPALYCVSLNPNGHDVDQVLVDANGPRRISVPTKQSSPTALRNRLERLSPDRSSRTDADLSHVYAVDAGRLRKVPLRASSRVPLPVSVSDGMVTGSYFERLYVARIRNPEDAGPASSVDSQAAPSGSRSYAALVSGIEGSIHKGGYGGGPNAPSGFAWGEPGTPGKCSRSNRDECLNCCSNIALAYTGAAVTAVASGAAGGAAVAGVGAVPGLVVGCIIGAFIGLAGVIHTNICSNDCSNLYGTRDGERVKNTRFHLTAAGYDDLGHQTSYLVETDDPAVQAAWSSDQVLQLVWAGAQVYAIVGNEESRVTLVRRKTSLHLRASADRSKTNNLKNLPAIMPG